MNENLTEPIYTKITPELKKKTKKQAIDIGIDYKDYISLALEHYSEHIDKKEIDFHTELFNG